MLTFQELQRRIGDDFFYQRHFGDDGNVVAEKQRLVREVTDTFGRAFAPGADALVAACFVPGRVEVLGKHTDYAGGRSLLAAVDRGFFCVSRQNGTRQVRLVEADDRFAPCEFELSADLKPVIGHWGNYPMTMVKRLAANFGLDAAEVAAGVDVAFGCDLPVAGGLSGSSALMIMTFFALALPNRLQEDSVFQLNIKSASDLAMFLACVENGQTFRDLSGRAGVGTFGGSEDHTQILNARRGQLSVFRFCPTRHETDVAFPGDLTLLIAHSGVKAEKTGAAMVRYNLVSKRARLAVDQYNDRFARRHRFLADIAAERSEGFDSCWPALAKAWATPEEELDLAGRFLQFYREDRELIPAAVDALQKRQDQRLGEVIDESHRLSATYLRNIIPEIDWLQRSARELGAVAASGFGAGFGGSAYAIVPKTLATEVLPAWRESYLRRYPQHQSACHFFPAAVSARAAEWFVDRAESSLGLAG